MSRDYKPSPERPKRANKGSPFFTGLLVGFLLGVAASLSVVVFINGKDSPFTTIAKPNKPLAEKILENQKNPAEVPVDIDTQINTDTQNEGAAQKEDVTRFDFYNILPGVENKTDATDSAIKENSAPSSPSNTYYLQVGAFQTAEEADNLKATLALQGFEAVVQTAANPDKDIWHRVRVGPLKNLDQISKVKADLLSSGFKADLVKVNHENQ